MAALSDPDNVDANGMSGERLEVSEVTTEHCAARFGRCNDKGVDSGTPARSTSERRRSPSQSHRHAFTNVANLEEPIDVRIGLLPSGE